MPAVMVPWVRKARPFPVAALTGALMSAAAAFA
jgi:hypothetical protein